MRCLKRLAVSVVLLSCLIARAGDKKKGLLPADVVRAQTVLVVVDPQAAIDPQHPNANRTAQEDVEKALMSWGRLSLAINAETADLIITVRKGSGKVVQPVIGGIPPNNRPIVLEPTDSGGRIGGGVGSRGSTGGPSPSQPTPELQVGQSQDMFAVYRSGKDDPYWTPLDAPPVWRYVAKDGLQSPGVPAVDAFRKLILESEKALAATP
jgi:hypothetical protein